MRNYGVERAIEIAELTAARPHPYVVGFSLAGDEAGYPPEPFADAYRIAAAAGLGCTVHAGEWAGRGLRARRARATRHAYRATACARSRIRRSSTSSRGAGSTLEVCPTSNVVLGVFPSYEEHPLPGPARRRESRSPSAPTTRRTSARASAASTRSPVSASV